MNVLMTGASGFVGTHVATALHRLGIQVTAVGRRRPDASINFVEADLLAPQDFSSLIRNVRPTHLLHLAWYAEHGKYWSSPLNLRWAEATVRLVEAFCEHGGQHVVVAGTCAEYDWTYGYCREESTPLEPATLYGVAKDATRRIVMKLCAQHDIACAWGRIFMPYGPGEATSRLIPSLFDVFRGRRAPFGINGAIFRDFLHVSDVASAFVAILQQQGRGTFNISSGEPVQLSQLAREVAGSFQQDAGPMLRLSSVRQGEPLLLVGENTRLKALGWQAEWSLADGLRNYAAVV